MHVRSPHQNRRHLGPASNSPEVLEQLDPGRDRRRPPQLLPRHPDEHCARARLVRELAAKHGRFVALLGDLQGPKIRIAKFANKRIELQVGDKFRFSTSHARDAGTQEVVGIDYPDLVKDCGSAMNLLLDDGRVVMVVEEVAADELRCRCWIGGPSDHRASTAAAAVSPRRR
ncbi:pyruvate kinase [Pseudomonas aeruginosa]